MKTISNPFPIILHYCQKQILHRKWSRARSKVLNRQAMLKRRIRLCISFDEKRIKSSADIRYDNFIIFTFDDVNFATDHATSMLHSLRTLNRHIINSNSL